jgi:hypothetical protein
MSAPIKFFKKGFVSVSIFEALDNFGNKKYSFSPQNGYFDKKENKTKYHTYFNDKDVLVLQILLDMAYKWLLTKEQTEKAKQPQKQIKQQIEDPYQLDESFPEPDNF